MNDETKSQLAELRAKRAEIEARRAARSDEDELAVETRALEEEQAIDAAEVEYGAVGRGIGFVRMPTGLLIVKRPPSSLWRKYADGQSRDNGPSATEGGLALVKGCAVYPKEKDRVAALLDEYPAALANLVKICAKLAGHRNDEEGKG